MLYTFLDAKNHCANFVESGTCPTKQVVADRINEACRRLLPKANWDATVIRMRYCMNNNTITLPRGGRAILNVTIDEVPRRVFGTSYEFLENGPGEISGLGGVGKDLLDLGDGWPTFYDIPSTTEGTAEAIVPSKLVAFSTAREDIGKQILICGRDSLNGDILTSGVPGEYLTIGWWQGGVEGVVSANNLPSLTTNSFKQITFVKKPVTVGYIGLYTYDSTDHRMYFLAKYHPDETQPGYRRYRLTAPDLDNGTNVLCQVKMRFEPMSHDTDLLPIQNLDALKAAVIAIREENAKNAASAKEYLSAAYGLLNDQTIDGRENADLQLQVSDAFSLGSSANII